MKLYHIMENICRLCLHKNPTSDMMDIFENVLVSRELNLAEFLYWTFGIEVYVEDTLTKLICIKCFNVIKNVSKLKHFFQTNQTILHDKKCPDDYVVQLGWYNTKEVGVNTIVKPEENITIGLNVLENLMSHPYVNITKLENSSVAAQYMKLTNTTYKKVNHKRLKVCSTRDTTHTVPELKPIEVIKPLSSFIKMENMSVTENNTKDCETEDNFEPDMRPIRVAPEIFKLFRQPILEIPRLDDIYIKEGYEKVNDFLYKQVEPDLLNKSLSDNKNDHNNACITVPLNTFENFSRPYVAVEKLEDSSILLKEYKKMNDVTVSECECSESRNEFYKDYSFPLQKINVEKNEKENTNKESREMKLKPLFKINGVEVCEFCDEIFKSKKSLHCHFYMKRNMLQQHSQQLKRLKTINKTPKLYEKSESEHS